MVSSFRRPLARSFSTDIVLDEYTRSMLLCHNDISIGRTEMNSVESTTISGGTTVLSSAEIDGFAAQFHGRLLRAGDDGYDAARAIWNAMIDKRPALIARCATTADVVRVVHFARDKELLLAIRGGGHNIAGNALCDGGIVIDLSQMKAASVNADARRVVIEGGATLADLDAATQAH